MKNGNRKHGESRRSAFFGERGVSLIETVVALGLFALGVATMGDFLTRQIRAGSSNYNYTTAYTLAEEQLETLRAQRFSDMGSDETSVRKGDMTFDVATSVDDGNPEPNLKTINVNVSWNEPGGQRNVSLQTIYTAIRR